MTRSGWVRLTLLVLFLTAGVGAYWLIAGRATPQIAETEGPGSSDEATVEQVRQFCGTGCHSYPPPDSFPRWAWRGEVEQGFRFASLAKSKTDGPSIESVIAYYENRAPTQLPLPHRPEAPERPSVSWQKHGFASMNRGAYPEVFNLNPVRLTPGGKLQILVCECDPNKNVGRLLLLDPNAESPAWKVLAELPSPVHTEVVDLDGDGHIDILVACVGQVFPTDKKVGSVVWLRGKGGEAFEPITLLRDVGRVADVQAADFMGNGKLDLVVAEFGWRQTGSVLLLENRTVDWGKPNFVPRILDDRHGTIHVPVADLNGDGKPDFVALISQEHETVVAFLNEGGGRFRKETIHQAPHPAFGSSGIQLVDLDGDGDTDVLYTNGDVLDRPFVLKPYHGVHWLENRGRFPFTHHRLAEMPGAMRAVAADIDGDGDLDVLAVAYLPDEEFPRRVELDLDSIIWLEQTTKGTFVRRPLETQNCDHFTCAVADLTGKGKPSLIVGNLWSSGRHTIKDAIVSWTFFKRSRE